MWYNDHSGNYRLPSVCSMSSQMTSRGISCSSNPASTLHTSQTNSVDLLPNKKQWTHLQPSISNGTYRSYDIYRVTVNRTVNGTYSDSWNWIKCWNLDYTKVKSLFNQPSILMLHQVLLAQMKWTLKGIWTAKKPAPYTLKICFQVSQVTAVSL